MNNAWLAIICTSLSASFFYWIGYLKGFNSGVKESTELINKTTNSVFGIFYEMKKKID